jgi:hypothetical protein
VRVLAFVIGSALLGQAPLQCSKGPDPDLRREETPPEALYSLATRFKAKGDERAWHDTLTFLLDRYPSSRFAMRARDELAGKSAPGASDPATDEPAPGPSAEPSRGATGDIEGKRSVEPPAGR